MSEEELRKIRKRESKWYVQFVKEYGTNNGTYWEYGRGYGDWDKGPYACYQRKEDTYDKYGELISIRIKGDEAILTVKDRDDEILELRMDEARSYRNILLREQLYDYTIWLREKDSKYV